MPRHSLKLHKRLPVHVLVGELRLDALVLRPGRRGHVPSAHKTPQHKTKAGKNQERQESRRRRPHPAQQIKQEAGYHTQQSTNKGGGKEPALTVAMAAVVAVATAAEGGHSSVRSRGTCAHGNHKGHCGSACGAQGEIYCRRARPRHTAKVAWVIGT